MYWLNGKSAFRWKTKKKDIDPNLVRFCELLEADFAYRFDDSSYGRLQILHGLMDALNIACDLHTHGENAKSAYNGKNCYWDLESLRGSGVASGYLHWLASRNEVSKLERKAPGLARKLLRDVSANRNTET